MVGGVQHAVYGANDRLDPRSQSPAQVVCQGAGLGPTDWRVTPQTVRLTHRTSKVYTEGHKRHAIMTMNSSMKPCDEVPLPPRVRNDALQAIEFLKASALDPLFWRAERLGSPSAWWQHVPFAHWLVDAVAPRTFVELGTHAGVSYAALCQAVVRSRLDTRCYAVDTWQGDPHAGEYGEEVFEDLRRYHDEHHGSFSSLLRCTFDEALGQFADGSIDLLHIDGFHTYEAVKHDFESWTPKLSDSAVVLFHDTNVMLNDFGVWRLWAELRQNHPSFEFLHGHGLGVLAMGKDVPPPIAALCALTDPMEIASLRSRFETLGERWLYDTHVRMLSREMGSRVAAASAAATQAQATIVAEATARANAELALREQAALRTKAARQETRVAMARAEVAEAELNRARTELNRARAEGKRARAERDAVMASTIWRASLPLRALGRRLPDRLRRALRAGAKLGWWCLTLQLPRRLQERRAALAKGLGSAAKDSGTAAPLSTPPRARPAASEPPTPTAAFVAIQGDTRRDRLRLVYISEGHSTPGHLYRVIRPAMAARAMGAETTWMAPSEIMTRLDQIAAANVLWIWRVPWSDALAAAVTAARRGGAKIVFDVDDLMVDPKLAQLDVIDGIRTQDLTEDFVRSHYGRIRATMLAADLCVATTDELAAFMRQARMPTRVLPNGFDYSTLAASRLAVRRRRAAGLGDGLVRIGYAGGTRTHQRDFALCVDAVADILRLHPECRLVAFRSADGSRAVLDVQEFAVLGDLRDRIEWRNFVPLEQLPDEIARFDINLAPLETGNPFCEAKSELKFFDAALVDVPTIASPTGPLRRAIRHGETGLLANTPAAWLVALGKLVDDCDLRQRLATAAHREVLWTFGPERRAELVSSLLDLLQGGLPAARAFQLRILSERNARRTAIHVPDHDVVFQADGLGTAEVTIVVPLYNYAQYVTEALDSVRAQSLRDLDLVVVDDYSTDNSIDVALTWARTHAPRFNRVVVVRNKTNSGLGFARNVGFDVADTPYVLPLDADNRLLPDCASACLQTVQRSSVAFTYPVIRQFGDAAGLMGVKGYDPVRLCNVNYIDAMALVSKAAWVAAGGYDHVRGGLEDYDFWCRLAELGLRGEQVQGDPLAEYRVHGTSMIQTASAHPQMLRDMIADLSRRHPWLTQVWPLPIPLPEDGTDLSSPADVPSRLVRFLPLLRCPESGGRLSLSTSGDALVSEDGVHRWPLIEGRPVLFPNMNAPIVNADQHLSNPLPASALALIHGARGPVLHLSAGGSADRFDHVIEVEAAIFRHTDLVADSHRLPFAEEAFEIVIALNAFEHYRDPRLVAREILRVLRPGGRVLIHTAFIQPLHEAPRHFYNCTRYGLETWFQGFETETLQVSDNFHAGHSLAWLASECEAALRKRLSSLSADEFLSAPIGRLVALWRTPETARGRDEPIWANLAALPQDAQEIVAAGFEFIGRRPM